MGKRPLFNSVGAVVLLLLALIPVLLMSLTGRERKTDFDRAFAEACGGTYECSEIADVQKAKAGGASVQAAYTAAKDGQIQVYVTELRGGRNVFRSGGNQSFFPDGTGNLRSERFGIRYRRGIASAGRRLVSCPFSRRQEDGCRTDIGPYRSRGGKP